MDGKSFLVREAIDVILQIPPYCHLELKKKAYSEGVRVAKKVAEAVEVVAVS